MTVAELKNYCKLRGIKGYSCFKKADLVEFILSQPLTPTKVTANVVEKEPEAANVNDSAWNSIPQAKKQGSGLLTTVSKETRAIAAMGRGESANYGSQVLTRRQAMLDQLRNK